MLAQKTATPVVGQSQTEEDHQPQPATYRDQAEEWGGVAHPHEDPNHHHPTSEFDIGSSETSDADPVGASDGEKRVGVSTCRLAML